MHQKLAGQSTDDPSIGASLYIRHGFAHHFSQIRRAFCVDPSDDGHYDFPHLFRAELIWLILRQNVQFCLFPIYKVLAITLLVFLDGVSSLFDFLGDNAGRTRFVQRTVIIDFRIAQRGHQ